MSREWEGLGWLIATSVHEVCGKDNYTAPPATPHHHPLSATSIFGDTVSAVSKKLTFVDNNSRGRPSGQGLKPVWLLISKSLGTRHESLLIQEFWSCHSRGTIFPVSAEPVQSNTSACSPYPTRGGIWPWTTSQIQVLSHRSHAASRLWNARVALSEFG
jgi:hypothetical protein